MPVTDFVQKQKSFAMIKYDRMNLVLKEMVRPENFYPPLERAQQNIQEHVFGSFLSRLEVGPI